MSHLPDLIKDLALILISAGIITLIFKWLKQPVVLGYIVAGILAGPYIHIFPSVTDIESVEIWAEIGVVFLLFALGLEFSFKKLMRVGGSAAITATTEVISMLIIGYFVGMMLGWSQMDSIFLGGMLSMSSTTIIIKAFNDLNINNQKFTGIVFGTLIVEDLVGILMMVLLSTMAVTHGFSGDLMLGSTLKVVFFLILWFLVGIYILPSFFRKVKKLMNDETLLIMSLGLCLGMVVLATETGFSSALGAFIMGSILAETIEAGHIEHIIKSVKDLFGAIFFVSVGMLVDPAILIEHAWPVVAITLVTIVCKSFFSSFGVLLSGQPLKTSIQSGFSLGQIGEFAFIIASLGISLGIMNKIIYPIIVAVSVITTFSTPYLIRLSGPFAEWLYRILPDRAIKFLNHYASGAKTVNHESDWKKLLRFYYTRMVVYIVLLTAIILVSVSYLTPLLETKISGIYGVILSAIITLLFMSPFLFALIANRDSLPFLFTLITNRANLPDIFMKLWNDNKYNRARLIFLVLLRVFVAIAAVIIVLVRFFDFGPFWEIVIALAILFLVLILQRNLKQYNRIEARFLNNLNERENAEKTRNPLKATFQSQLENKNIHIAKMVISPHSLYVGKTLKELDLRKNYGISIISIARGGRRRYIPGSAEFIYPFDKISVVGTDEQIDLFSKAIESENNPEMVQEYNNEKEVELQSFIIDEHFPYMDMSIQESGIGEKYNCLIIGIERESASIMNPDISTVFECGDLVWVVAEKKCETWMTKPKS